ncbi:MAG: DUF2934 domain-containing protein [Chitinispirillaceae bacterium]|nr:DUF2934 domain-containing protein [Chitinispirillaceae bacterium]
MTIGIEDDIRKRAFDLYVKRGETHGKDQDDWFEAEKELRNRNGKKESNRRPVVR